MVDLNGADVESLPTKSVREYLMKTEKCSEDEVPHVEGTALFSLHSCFNHSCKPNCQVIGGCLFFKKKKSLLEIIIIFLIICISLSLIN